MPHLIVSTVALLANLYKNAPLIVGDKDSDPDLMRFLGARMTTNYPACGSPPMYVMHAPPRTVFDNLEKRGYCLMSAQTIQEHSVWILARPRIPDDDKVEISRGGPNDKSVQAFDDPENPSAQPSSKTPSTSRARSPTKNPPRITLTPSTSKQTLNEERNKNLTVQMHPVLIQEGSVNQKPLLVEDQALCATIEKYSSIVREGSTIKIKSTLDENQVLCSGSQKQPLEVEPVVQYRNIMEIPTLSEKKTRSASPDKRNREKSPNGVTLSVQIRESSPIRKSTHRTKKILENQKLSVEIIENEPKRRSSHKSRKELEDARSRSVSPEKRAIRNISPNSQSLTIQIPENLPTQRSYQMDKKTLFEMESTRSISSEKMLNRICDCSTERVPLQQARGRKLVHEERGPTCNHHEQDTHSRRRTLQKDKKPSFGQEDSQDILIYNKKDLGNVTSRGDAGTYWSGSEKVHMGIQASNSEVSLKKSSDIMSRVAFNARKHSDLLKNSNELLQNPLQDETHKKKSSLKRSSSSPTKQTQASFSYDPLMKPSKGSTSVHFANPTDVLDIDKSSMSDTPVHELPRAINLNNQQSGSTDPYINKSQSDQRSHFIDVEKSAIMKEARVFNDSVILTSLASRCSHIAIVGDADNPIFIDITDPNNLTCLTQETCCCEEN